MSITDKSAEAGFFCGEMSKMTDFPCTYSKILVPLHPILVHNQYRWHQQRKKVVKMRYTAQNVARKVYREI